jgi:hypothetical protein
MKTNKRLGLCYLVGIIWSIFSIWICFREREYLWALFLIGLGLLPLFWMKFISPKFHETESVSNAPDEDKTNRSFKKSPINKKDFKNS